VSRGEHVSDEAGANINGGQRSRAAQPIRYAYRWRPPAVSIYIPPTAIASCSVHSHSHTHSHGVTPQFTSLYKQPRTRLSWQLNTGQHDSTSCQL